MASANTAAVAEGELVKVESEINNLQVPHRYLQVPYQLQLAAWMYVQS